MNHKLLFLKGVLLLSFLLFINSPKAKGQEIKGITFPRSNQQRHQKCNSFLQVYRQKPKEVRFSVKKDKDKLFLETNDKQWFDSLFKSSGDGIAIDVVSKNRYTCDSFVEKNQLQHQFLHMIP